MATQTQQPDTMFDQNENALNENPGPGDSTDVKNDSDITPSELELLDDAGTEDGDELTDDQLLDDTDDDGDELNEDDDLTGDDLDVPGSEDDDMDESIGEEDEENNSYSTPDEDEDEEKDDSIL